MGRPAKALSGFNRTVGSNPTLSAKLVRQIIGAIIVLTFPFTLIKPVRADCIPSYVVKSGDSWWRISRKANVNIDVLLRLNKAKKWTNLNPEDVICIPNSMPKPKTIYGEKQIIQIIRDIWPDKLENRAIQIARRESNLNPRVIGIPNECCYGLFQIYYRWHKSWMPSIGVTSAQQLLDPETNARAALEIYRRNRGWGPWG